MAVTITDTNRAVWDAADSTTGWSTGTSNTTDYAEASGSITTSFDTTSGIIEHTDTGTDLSSSLIYVWSANIAEQNTWKPGTLSTSPHCLYISDSTNALSLLQAGNDREVFKHADTQVIFQCFVIDTEYLSTKNTAGEIYANSGSVASFDNTSITEIGAYYTTNAKAFKGWNCGVDIIRTGAYADAVICAGGTTGDRGTWLEFVEEDRSKLTGDALGVIREYTSGIYGCQGTIQLGITTAASYFEDSGFVVAWEDRDVTDNAFRFYTAGYSSGTTLIAFSNGTFASAGPGVLFDASAANVATLTFDGCTFSNLLNAVSFPTDSTTRTHEVTNCVFNNCGQIDPGTADFQGCTIAASNASVNGAVLLDSDGTTNWSGNTWISGGTGHAIEIPNGATGTYTFTNMTFTGYAAQGGTATDRAVYNNSGGAVTINNSGSTGITYRNGTSATTTIVDTITVTYTGIVNGTEIRVYETGTSTEKDGIESVTGGQFAASLQGSTGYDVVAIYPGYIPIRQENVSYTSSTSIDLNQQEDRNQSNP